MLGMRVHLVCVVALRLPAAQCALAQSQVGDGGVDLCQAMTSSGACLAVRHRARAALLQEWCHRIDSLPHSARKALSDPHIQLLLRIFSL